MDITQKNYKNRQCQSVLELISKQTILLYINIIT